MIVEFKDEDVEVTVGCTAVHPESGTHLDGSVRLGPKDRHNKVRGCLGVRVTHKPTGLSLVYARESSQYANLEWAIGCLEQLVVKQGKVK